MKNMQNGTEYVWPKEKFFNRLYLMKEMYSNYEDDEDWDLPSVCMFQPYCIYSYLLDLYLKIYYK
jgi:hypothetical protein